MEEKEMTMDRNTDIAIRATDNSLKDGDFEAAHQEPRLLTAEEIAAYVEGLSGEEDANA